MKQNDRPRTIPPKEAQVLLEKAQAVEYDTSTYAVDPFTRNNKHKGD